MRFLVEHPKALSSILIGLDVWIAISYLCVSRDLNKAVYWISAAVLTTAVTFKF